MGGQRVQPKRKNHLAWHSPSHPLPFYVSIYLVSAQLSDDSPIWPLASELQSNSTCESIFPPTNNFGLAEGKTIPS